ncbi:TlpA family protein disulfide reductase [Acetobacterium woodii]|uniref:Redoxin domain protein n=1 Tax=Acetobacterium woodii (strain ATCC 29683 / DSM 1030 / JCM 2381 / KCTC 1655 / WB1) TaxID=931626 RepID=H6LID4_ACEWD|nr:TlpA disulfide reductase family protein [Acetobacterium woodii]AFA47308.1 redoxin domain protein [Acetobacterium woodii DSM 1030]
MTNKTKTIIGLVAFAIFLGLAYWGYTFLSATFNPSQSSQTDELQTAPDFTIYDQDGNPVKLSDFSGKPVVLNFWASWCPPCKSEMPHFNAVYQDQKDDVVFLMVDQADGERETNEKAQQFVTAQGFDFPIYFDSKSEASIAYGVSSIPTTLFINPEGKIVSGYRGALDESALLEGINLIKN